MPKARSWLGTAKELFTYPQCSEISSHHTAPDLRAVVEKYVMIHKNKPLLLAAILPVNLLLASKWSTPKRKQVNIFKKNKSNTPLKGEVCGVEELARV